MPTTISHNVDVQSSLEPSTIQSDKTVQDANDTVSVDIDVTNVGIIENITDSIIYKFVRYNILTALNALLSSDTVSKTAKTINNTIKACGIKVITSHEFLESVDEPAMLNGVVMLNTAISTMYQSVLINWNNYVVFPFMGVISIKFIIIVTCLFIIYTLYSLIKLTLLGAVLVKIYELYTTTTPQQNTAMSAQNKQHVN